MKSHSIAGRLALLFGLSVALVSSIAGAALYAAGRAVSIADGITQARAALEGGKARAKLDEFVAATRRLAGK